ncbi:MAG TPA: peptidoglycan recognition family protein [Actinomycetes bacterium]|nr:peptidoglycan recognition family protein [Actinomycetes bacterium]
MTRSVAMALCGSLLVGTAVVGLPASANVPAGGAPSRDRITVSAQRAEPVSKLKPRLVRKYIPFGHRRKMQMARYSKRHYGHRAYHLRHPRVIVEHYTDGPTMMSAWWTMANNTKNLGEFPGVCTHFIIDKDGRIYRTVPLNLRCRHTIGLNQTAIGIEHVGTSDHQVLSRHHQRRASYRLTLWLMAKYNIPVKNVIGHGESLLSPYRHEKYRSWKCLTHTDFSHRTMHRYRDRLRTAARRHGVRVGHRPHWVDIGC